MLGIQLDEYRIMTPLGSGGMARVYRALDTQLQRYVALKVIASDFRSDDEYRIRFAREAQSIARLEHPNIVHIYRLGEANGLYYMAMKYIEGTDLRRLIDNYRNANELIPLEEIVRFVDEIGAALDYAHAQSVIHRDVKPSNILIDQAGHAILTDFGLVFLRDIDNADPVFGSPQYMAPEQAAFSRNVVPQSDLYSLGVTLFEMLTGELPFNGSDALELARRHLSEPPPLPSRINPAIPPVIDAVVLRCLEKEPQKRYQTGAELSAALRQGTEFWTANSLRMTQSAQRAPAWNTQTQQVESQAPFLAARQNTVAAPGGSIPSLSWPQQQRHLGLYLIGLLIMLLVCSGVTILATAVLGGRFSQMAVILTPVPVSTTASASLTPLFIPPPFTALSSPINPPPTDLSPNLPPTNLPPTATAVTLYSPPPAPPADRASVPPGSQRLGEFAVEWYCNNQRLGVQIINNQTAWACTNKDGSIRFVLGPADFDNICRTTYKNQAAFAIRDQQKAVQAYNWSCYVYR